MDEVENIFKILILWSMRLNMSLLMIIAEYYDNWMTNSGTPLIWQPARHQKLAVLSGWLY